MLETHILVHSACVFRVPFKSLLLPRIRYKYPSVFWVFSTDQLCDSWCYCVVCVRCMLRSFHRNEPDWSSFITTVSIQARALSCVLGPQFLGFVCCIGQNLDESTQSRWEICDHDGGYALDSISILVDDAIEGLVTDDQSFIVLPNISPQITLIASVLSMLLPLKQCWSNPSFESFIRGIFMCGFGSFLFGWHVHEKAIMLVTIPMSLLAISCPKHARNFLILSTAGYFALFPLLFRPQETVLKIAILMSYIIGAVIALKKLFSTKDKLSFSWLELAYLFGFVMVQSFVSVIHPLLFGDKLPFLPLMCISTYSAIGTVYVWLRCLIQI
eukprot:m.69060 g.69060  ORF g.69060 m.69060 type:complete len:328 (-) comp12024_c0_seq2:64-1047(-)